MISDVCDAKKNARAMQSETGVFKTKVRPNSRLQRAALTPRR